LNRCMKATVNFILHLSRIGDTPNLRTNEAQRSDRNIFFGCGIASIRDLGRSSSGYTSI
jgi:hypothetical protein